MIELLSTDAFYVGITVGVGITLALGALFAWIRPWVKAWFAGASLPFIHVIGMRLRQTPVELMVDAHITLTKRGISVAWEELEAQYLAHRGAIRTELDLVRIAEQHRNAR